MKWPQYLHGRKGGDSHIRDEVFSGMYEARYQPKAGDVVVDAGAHIGFYTCRASQWVGPTGQVFSFEPETANYLYLSREHKKECGLENVAMYQIALWNEPQKMVLNHSNSSAEHSLVTRQRLGCETDEEVLCMPLDEVLPKDLKRLDFIKIDIEGAEHAMLQGAFPLLEKFRPHMVIELDTRERVALVKDFLEVMLRYKLVQETPTVWSAVP